VPFISLTSTVVETIKLISDTWLAKKWLSRLYLLTKFLSVWTYKGTCSFIKKNIDPSFLCDVYWDLWNELYKNTDNFNKYYKVYWLEQMAMHMILCKQTIILNLRMSYKLM